MTTIRVPDVEMTLKITLLILTFIFVVKLTKAELTGFIVGGEFTTIVKYPHSVFLYINPKDFMCGASILNQAILLTAAHCVYVCLGQSCSITAYTGSTTRFKGSVNNVSSFKVHEKYEDRTKANDIALLRLAKDLWLGITVKRIIIMKSPPKFESANVAGWGRVNQSAASSSFTLKHTKQMILNRKTCKSLIDKIPRGTFCGQAHSYPHRGDSGSALVIYKRMIQIGIVSFKKPSRSTNTEVYTNVSYFYNWIMDNARILYCQRKKLNTDTVNRVTVLPKEGKGKWCFHGIDNAI